MNDTIMVSVVCNTYNQIDYIEDTLKGFLMQKTDFAFEILVHDDASVDGTRELVQKYEKKYPEKIKAICQEKNQYSQNININEVFQYPRAKGKYIAYCEGDDQWIAPDKLQRQVDYMEAHPECSLCFTNGQCHIGRKPVRRVVPWESVNAPYFKKGDADYDTAEMMFLDYVPSASLMHPTKWAKEIPILTDEAFCGDSFVRLFMTSRGYAHYIDMDSCIYNLGVANSTTTQWFQEPIKFRRFTESFVKMLRELDDLLEYRYHDAFELEITKREYKLYKNWNEYLKLREKKYQQYAKKNGWVFYLKYLIITRCNWLYKKKIKQ